MEYIFETLGNLVRQTAFFNLTWGNFIMILVACVFLYLAIKKDYEPLLLVPIAFGMLLVNIYPDIIASPEETSNGVGGLLYYFYVLDEWSVLPSLIFMGVGAMTDFGPLIANPKSFLLGAAAQFGIFVAYLGAMLMGFSDKAAAAISIIGGADGPTSIFLAGKLEQTALLGPIAVAAYSYMALVPIIQPPIMRLLTTEKERKIKMEQLRPVSKLEKILFPIIVTIVVCLILPTTAPLVGALMLGNLFRESGVVKQLTETASNAMMYIVVILLGTSVGATASAEAFLTADTLKIVALGLIAFAFGSFLEGTAGFGTPVAITAAMLAGLGFNPIYGAGLCLIANTAPVAFGAIGVPLIVAAQVSGLDQMTVSAIAGRQLPLLSLIVPLWVCVVMCGFKRSMEVLPAIIVAGVAFGGAQFLLANFHGPTLPDIGSAIATIVALMLLLKVWQPKSIFRFEGEAPSNLEGQGYPLAVVLRAWAPYLVLAVFVFFWGLGSFKAILNGLPGTVFNISWPGLDGEVMKTAPIVQADAVYGAKFTFNWLSAGGTAILLSGLVSVPFMPKYGYGKAIACFMRTLKQLTFPILTIAMILGLAYLMNYSGMSSTLGLAFTHTGWLFPFFSPLLGWLGVFLTGSDTSSCALFGGMQKDTALAVGMRPELAVASNASGGVTAKMISPQSLSVATAATNNAGQEGKLFRFTIGHSIGMTLVLCVLAYLQAGPLSWMLP